MILQDWSYEGDNFYDKILYDPIHIGDCKLSALIDHVSFGRLL